MIFGHWLWIKSKEKTMSSRSRIVSLIFLMFTLSWSQTSNLFPARSLQADMKPDDPVFEENSTIILNCSFTRFYNGTQNSSDFRFRHNAVTYGPEFVYPLTPTTAQLRLPNASVLYHYGHFVCRLWPDINVNLGAGASQNVAIARRPLKPKITDCIVNNWDYLQCSWSPSREMQRNYSHSAAFKQIIVWSVSGVDDKVCKRNLTDGIFKLTADGSGSCGFEFGESYCLQLNTSNILNISVVSDRSCFDTLALVKPSPPTKVQTQINGTRVASISWTEMVSRNDHNTSLLYSLSFISTWNKTVTSIVKRDVKSLTIPVLCWTTYNVSIRIKPPESGFWSDEKKYDFMTSTEKPSHHPSMAKNGFTLLSDDISSRKVRIFWQPISQLDFCGPHLKYVPYVRIGGGGEWNEVKQARTTDAAVNLEIGEVTYEVRVWSRNDEGISADPSYQIIQIPSSVSVSSPVSEVVVELDLASALVHWTYEEQDLNVTSVTVFWCSTLSELHLCRTGVEWKDLTTTQKEYELMNLTKGNEMLKVGIGIDVDGLSCGIKWSTELYSMWAGAPSPVYLKAVTPFRADNGGLHVTWSKPYCYSCGYINSYILEYCRVSSNKSCIDDTNVVVIPSNQFAFNLTGLKHGALYRLLMYSRTRANNSLTPPSEIFVETSSSWLTTGAIVGISFGVVILICIAIFGLCGIYKYCNKCQQKFKVEIVVPTMQKNIHSSSSSEAPIFNYNNVLGDYSRQGSRASAFSKDSGRSSLNQSINVSSVPLLSMLSPSSTYPNGAITTTLSNMTPLMEDTNVDEVFTPILDFDGGNYVKSTLLDELLPSHINSDSDYVRSFGFDDDPGSGMLAAVPRMPGIPWNETQGIVPNGILRENGSHRKPDLLQFSSMDGNDDDGNYFRIKEETLFADVVGSPHDPSAAVQRPTQLVPLSSATGIQFPHDVQPRPSSPLPPPPPHPPHPPPPASDISYTRIEMLDPNNFPRNPTALDCGSGSRQNICGNVSYTDLAFLTNAPIGRASVGEPVVTITSCTASRNDRDSELEKRTDGDNRLRDLSDLSSHHRRNETLALNENRELDSDRSSIDGGECLTIVESSSDPNYARFGSSLESTDANQHPSSEDRLDPRESLDPTTDPLIRRTAAPDGDAAEENKDFIPNTRMPVSASVSNGNGYVLHNDIFGAVLA